VPVSTLLPRWRSLLPADVPWYRQRLLRIAAGVLAGYALAGFLLLPAALKHFLPGALQDALGVQASVDGVSFNPFTLRLELLDLRITEMNGVPLGSVQRIVADAETSSLFNWAWTFAEISLHQPELDLVIEKDGRLNFARVATALPPEPDASPDQAPMRLLMHRVDLIGARVRFNDQSTATPASTEIGPSDLHVARLSTLPDQRGDGRLEVQMAGGARISWEGQLGLHPLVSSGTLVLADLAPAAFHDFLRSRLMLDPVGGSLTASLRYELSAVGDNLSFSTQDMRFDLRDLLLRKAGASKPLLTLGSLTAQDGSFDLAGLRLRVGKLGIAGGALAANIDRDDVLDWDTLLVPAAPAPVTVPAGPAVPWSAEVGEVAIADIGLDLYDQTRNAPLGLALTLKHAAFAVRAAPGKDGPAVILSGASLEADDIALSTGAERTALGTIARLTLAGAEVDVAAEELSAARLSIDGLDTSLLRERDGRIRQVWLASAPDPVTPLPVTHAASEWRVRLGEFQLGGLDAALADASTTPAIAYAVKGGSLSLKNIDTGGTAPVQLEAKLPVAQGGEIALSGTASPDGSAADVALRIATLALSPLAPRVAQDTTLLLDSGTLSTHLDIRYRSPAAAPLALTVSGGASVDDLRLREAEGGGHFLGWTALEAAGLDFSLGPDHLGIAELRVKGADAKVVVQKDRSVNLAEVMREPAATSEAGDPATAVASAAPAGAAAVSAAPVAEAASAPEAFPVVIDRIRVEDSVVDFADYSLVLPFAARIESLKGVAKGISSDANSRATLAFSGRVGEYGEADIDGQLAPFDPMHFTDIEIAFRNIALTPLSPYSATFAGRTIKTGDLDLALQYKVDNQKLLGKNEVVLHNFKLGESVKSKDAVSLPLDLAIALLSDSKGRIDLAVPVSGDVGDPKFSYGHLIWKAIGNLITGVVTAPFRALGSLFGGGAEEQVQDIRFMSGSAELMPMERQRIAKVATALSQRPKLAVRVPAATHPERDGYALRRFELRRLHAAEMGYELAAGEDPGPVSYSNGRSQRALEKLLAVRGGDDAADRFAASWAKKQGREPERVNAALAMVGRGSPDHEFYRALYLELVNTTPEPPGGMQALARARAEAISTEFRARGVEAARVSIGKAAPMQKAKPSGVMLPLELVAAG
jgi:uncharacterized protein involved in outer membrane biogenesis